MRCISRWRWNGWYWSKFEARHWGRDLKLFVLKKLISTKVAVAQGLYAINWYMNAMDENQPEVR